MAGLMSSSARSACQVLLAVLLAAGGAVAQEAVLLTSTAPSYTPGMVITASDQLTIPEGALVALLFRSGQILRLRGPYVGALDAIGPGREGVASIAEAFRLRGVDASVIGATRTANAARPGVRSQEIQVDAERSGTYCIGPADTVWLSRASADSGNIALGQRGNLRMVNWPQGAERIEWPADIPIEEGEHFEVLADGKPIATLVFRIVSGAAPTGAAAVAEGVLLGCREQHEGELRRLARRAVPPEIWLTTDRGHSPTYHSGEVIALSATASAEGWLTCVLIRADGAVLPLDKPAARSTATVHTLLRFEPGADVGTLRAGPPGTEEVRCWLSDRNVAQDLPEALLTSSDEPLPRTLAANLDATFARIPGTHMISASIMIRVE